MGEVHQTHVSHACEPELNKPTLEKFTVATLPSFQKSQAHPSQMLVLRTLLRPPQVIKIEIERKREITKRKTQAPGSRL